MCAQFNRVRAGGHPGCWVHSGVPWGAMGSSGVVGFTRVRPGGRRVHPGSLDSLTCALRFVRFIWRRWVYSCVLSSIVCALGVVGFTRVFPGDGWVSSRGRRVHPGSLGSLTCALSFVGFIWGGWVHSDAPWGSFGSLASTLWVVGFIQGVRWVHSDAPWGSFGSFMVVDFTRVRP